MPAPPSPEDSPESQPTPEPGSGVELRVDPSPSESVLGAGSTVELRKPHACGGLQWTVTRLGADVGLRCLACNRLILLPRQEFQRRLRRIC